MDVTEIAAEVSAEELPGDLPLIADVIGVEATIKLAIAFRGCSVYVRNIDPILRKRRNTRIRNEYDNGKRVLSLAVKYHLSTRQIESILSTGE